MNIHNFYKLNFKKDLQSSFIVFLVALPLSLGISMASGTPPMAGLIAAVIGGLVVSILGGGNVSINGPAAGLIVVVLNGIEVLGSGDTFQGYKGVLAITVVAGIILFIAGKFFKAGSLSEFFPSSVVHGMLAAIGVIIVSKQIHIVLGVSPTSKSPLSLVAEIPNSLALMNPEVALIGFVSLVIMIYHNRINLNWIKKIPAPMIVVFVGFLFTSFFDFEHEHTYLFANGHEYSVGPRFLVNLPEKLIDGFVWPDFKALLKPGAIGILISLTIVQGLETLLSASAVDKFDPLKRKTFQNKDLAAVGFASALSGLIGGLPIITEIVRSRLNVSSGGQSQLSNFLHSLFILVFVVFLPHFIHQIPLASLASILIFIGYKLADPQSIKHTYEHGYDQFIIFMSTLFATIATDLLIGVFVGILVKLFLHLLRGVSPKKLFKGNFKLEIESDVYFVRIGRPAIFLNYFSLRKILNQIPLGKKVYIDFSNCPFVDSTIMEKIIEFTESYKHVGDEIQHLNLDKFKSYGNQTISARVQKKSSL